MAEGESLPKTVFANDGNGVKADGSSQHPYEVKPGQYKVAALVEMVGMAKTRIPMGEEDGSSSFHFSFSHVSVSLNLKEHQGTIEYLDGGVLERSHIFW